jgi:hypothetical protein
MHPNSNLKNSTKERIGLVVFLTVVGSLVWLTHSRASNLSDLLTNPVQRQQQKDPNCKSCSPLRQRVIYAPLIDLPDASGSEIVLNCRSTRDVPITPTFYTLEGQAIQGDVIVLHPAEIRFLDTKSLIPASVRYMHKWGGMTFSYEGGLMEAWAQLTIHGIRGGGSANVVFTVLGLPRSNISEAVWWVPNKGSALLALGNSTGQEVNATLTFPSRQTMAVTVKPFATELVPLENEFVGRKAGRADAVRVNYTGGDGGLIPTGFTTSADGQFASMIRFYDTQNLVQQNLFASSLRLDQTVPHLVLRNTSADYVTATPKFLSGSGDDSRVITLADVSLAPFEAREVELTPLVSAASRLGLQTVDLRVANSGRAGTLIGALYAINAQTGTSYDVPLRDSGPPRASTGGYPVRLDGDYTTVISITNTTEQIGDFTMQFNYREGRYATGIVRLKPGATHRFDLRKLRDNQFPDIYGNPLPRDLEFAQAVWSMRGNVRLNGRSEIVSLRDKVSSSYSCFLCCPNSFSYGYITPLYPPSIYPGGTQEFHVWEQDDNGPYCGGTPLPYPVDGYAYWWSDDPEIADIDWHQTAEGRRPGWTDINAQWPVTYWWWDEMDAWCEPTDSTAWVDRSIEVQPPTITVDEVGFTGDHPMKKFSNDSSIDNPDGSSPTWKRGPSNPNLPAAYTKGADPTMFAKFGVSPAMPPLNAVIRAKSGSTTIMAAFITFYGSTINLSGLTTSNASSTTVITTTPTYTWEITYDGYQWYSMGSSGPHTLHWTYAAPMSPPFRDFDGNTYGLYDLALEKACGAAAGSADQTTIVQRINTSVASDTFYEPSQALSGNPLNAYTHSCLCADLALLLRGLMRSVGIDGSVQYIWGGLDSSTQRKFIRPSQGNQGEFNPTFQVLRSATDGAEANPHFTYHAVVPFGGQLYDPSYGINYASLVFNETACFNTPQQTSTTFPGFYVQSGCSCGH